MLTTTSKYALRTLVVLARQRRDAFVLGRTLSAATEVPTHYLAKILGTLGTAGLVEAVRGRKGGYRLARPAVDIRLVEAVELFEGVRTDPACVLGVHETCSDAAPCSAHHLFRDVRARYVAFLEDTSIADVARMEDAHLPMGTPS